MAQPQPVDFSRALQDLERCFEAPDLARGTVVHGPDGSPLVRYGDSACVFKIATSGGDVAVRCFTRQSMGMQERYAALGNHLREVRPDSLVGFEYLEQGIRVDGEWYPIVRMEWAEGDRLDRFVGDRIGEPEALLNLAARWRSAMASLRGLGIAHNDLEPGNILVAENGDLSLVDYDGMFIPRFRGQQSPEFGHQNYRHPHRTTRDYDESVDNFPSLVIHLNLLALAADPSLWERFHGLDNLLLARKDFVNPDRSACIDALGSSPDGRVAALADRLQQYCSGPIDQVPDLETILRDIPVAVQYPASEAPPLETSPEDAPAPTESSVQDSLPPALATTKEEALPIAAPTPAHETPVTEASPPDLPAVAANEAVVSNGFLFSGSFMLGLLIAASACLLLTFLVKPAFLAALILLSIILCLLPIQARSATRLPVAAAVGAGLVVYFFSVIQNGTFADPFSHTRDTTIENAAAVFFGIGLAIVSAGLAARMLGFTRAPNPPTTLIQFIDRLSRYNRAGMVLPAIGIPLFILGLAPQEFIDTFFFKPEGTDYVRGGGIRPEAAALFWPLMFLDKVESLGAFCFWLGITLLVLGVPRRLLFAYILKRGEAIARAAQARAGIQKSMKQKLASLRKYGPDHRDEDLDAVDEAYAIMFYISLFVFGMLTLFFVDNILDGFIIATVQEFGISLTGDWRFLSGDNYPGWLIVLDGVLRAVGAICGGFGLIMLIISLRTFRKLMSGVESVLDAIPASPPARSGSATTTSSGSEESTSHGGAGYGATLIARARGRGGSGR